MVRSIVPELAVVAPALVDVGLGQLEQSFRPVRVGAGEHGEAGLGGDEVGDRDRRLLGVELEGDPVLGLARLEAVQRPVAGLDGVLLVAHRLGHVDAVGDARRVGDHERRPGPGVGLEEGLGRLEVVGPDGDLGDVDVAVGAGDGAEILLAARLAGGGELGHGAPGRRLRRLAAGVRVHLGVEHEDVDVAPGRQDVVEPAEADVVGPAVAADDPHALAGQAAGECQQVAGRRHRRGRRSRRAAAARRGARRPARAGRGCRPRTPDRRPGSTRRASATDGAAELLEQRGRQRRLRLQAEPQPEPELGIVLEQRVAPRRARGPRRSPSTASSAGCRRRSTSSRWRWPPPCGRRTAA